MGNTVESLKIIEQSNFTEMKILFGMGHYLKPLDEPNPNKENFDILIGENTT